MSRLTIKGLQEAQAANLRLMAAVRPSGALGRAVQRATIAAHRYAVTLTHVDTGALRASHRMDYGTGSGWAQGRVFIDPTARNPRSRALTSRYGPVEEARGGTHRFYGRVVDEKAHAIASEARAAFLGGLP
jgi:hypothetical protein